MKKIIHEDNLDSVSMDYIVFWFVSIFTLRRLPNVEKKKRELYEKLIALRSNK